MSPMRALHPCSYPGCSELVHQGSRCDKHKVVAQSFKRDPDIQRLYDRNWQRRRRKQLTTQPWCEDCLEQSIYVEATDVHHEQRHGGDREIFLNSPLRSLCHDCHSRHTAYEVNGRGGKKVSDWRASSARGQQHEKNSQCGESGLMGAPDACA